MNMSWISVIIQAQDHTAEIISDTLMELGALSAIIEDANADTIDEQAIFGEPGDPPPGVWQKNLVSAMFDEDVDVEQMMHDLQTQTQLSDLLYTTSEIQEQDWVRATQSQFNPIQINEQLWIVPTWHNVIDSEAINIVLDPGLAFGTGSHPTTHLCLDWLTKNVKHHESVLDYGCGSGILAIAAKKLHASTVVGTDIDDQAIISSRYNAEQNSVDIHFEHAEQYEIKQFDIVVANILSSALSVLAPVLATACKQNGKVALSGILFEQTEQLTKIYSQWFEMEPPVRMESWVLLTGIKK